MLLFMAIVLYGPSLALNAVTGLSLWGSIVAVSLVCTFYTTLGGMKAVVWTDTLQCCIMLAGMFCLIIQGSILVGGFDKVWEIADRHNRIVFNVFDPDPTVRHSVWNVVIGGGFMWATIYGINQAQVQRAISVSTLKKAKLAVFLNIPGMFLIQTLACTCGVVMFAFYHTCDPVSFGLVQKGDQLIPLFMLDILGHITGLSGLLLSCIFSGSLSTISSGLNAMSAVMIKDFITPNCCPKINEFWATILSKAMVVVFGFLALLLAFVVSTMGAILQATYLLFGFLGGPILGIFVLGMLFPWTNKWGALVGEMVSLVILMWIGLGNFINKVATSNPSPVLTTGCNWNLTRTTPVLEGVSLRNTTGMTSYFTDVTTESSMSITNATTSIDPLDRLYSLSYMWYTPLAVLITVVVGLIVSFITGATKPSSIDPRLICPVFDVFFPYLPERIRKPLRFGVRHDEVLEMSVAKDNVEMELPIKPTTDHANDKTPPGTQNSLLENTEHPTRTQIQLRLDHTLREPMKTADGDGLGDFRYQYEGLLSLTWFGEG
ncbi:hypothetical protein ScPMuIL_005113 [Solemya velum]